MAKALKAGQFVYVPRARLKLDLDDESAFLKTRIHSTSRRSVRVVLPDDGGPSDWIGSSAVHRSIGILVVRIGDYHTEQKLLEPLAKSILQYFRMLLPDDLVCGFALRTLEELREFWSSEHRRFSHVVLIGHGRHDGICFGVNTWQNAIELGAIFSKPRPDPKTFLSLACQTGYAAFGGPFSGLDACQSLVAPFHAVHGAVASQFCQTLFANHLLTGSTLRVAFNRSRKAIAGGVHFRLWEKGQMTGEKS